VSIVDEHTRDASAAWSTATSPVTTSAVLGVTRLAARQQLVLLEATAVD
jgi:hypothetical protein